MKTFIRIQTKYEIVTRWWRLQCKKWSLRCQQIWIRLLIVELMHRYINREVYK